MKKFLFILILISLVNYLFLPFQSFAQDKEICKFSRSLFPGLKGEDVKCLQKFLEDEGFFKYQGGPTGYYGKITQEAVKKWQKANNIKPALGYFGSKSLNKYIEILISKQKKYQDQRLSTTTSTTSTTTNISSITTTDVIYYPSFSILKIPEISDNDLIINENGLHKTLDYLETYYYKLDINLDLNKLTDLSIEITTTSPPEDYLFVPHLLIEETLNNPLANSNKINQKLDFLLEFYKQKIKAVQKINVHPELKEFHKKMYLTDLLTIELIETYKKYQEGFLDKEYLVKYLNEYKTFINGIEKEMIKILPVSSASKFYYNSILNSFLKFLDKIIKPVKAQQLPFPFYPFGGRIIIVKPCPCSAGYLFYITPPKPPPPPLGLFASYAFLASPFFYMWKQLRPPVWVLGNAFTVPVPCLIPGSLGCFPIGSGLPVYMMGTSLF